MMANGKAAALSQEASRWVEAHEALSRLARERAALDAEEGPWLLQALRSAAHVQLGFGPFAQYIERLFGYRPRTTQEKLRVAEALEGLPRMSAALRSGALGWCAVRELTRVVVPETEPAWLDAARGKTLRELEALVADKSAGDAPDAPARGAPRRHVLRFEVEADTFATFREAMQRLERAAGGRMGHDELLLAMARQVVGARATPTWTWATTNGTAPLAHSRAPARAYRPPCAAPSSSGIGAAARCPAAPTPRTWTFTTFGDAPTAA